ncbi:MULTISPECIES: hypothetical protein [unclassified Janthinobacterium]|uniref:hypothetical protein n=1 Tax=unclassified Janthinobacterium TaxID=2610881 RepID=UPI00160DC3A6|nr:MULTISPECIES: hypothetical protein [unclassified Janthinobacterium]MBB5607357.1 hypothetical protein [Janthinobacterium sp. S3T4]MBB5612378.1 hypothetical protein [Janthinobacterium sp. S3M3]
MLLVVKFFITILLLSFSTSAISKDIYVLLLQEKTSSICKVEMLDGVQGVYQLGLDGQEIPVRSSSFSGNCMESGIWISLGQEMIKSAKASRVIFMLVGAERTAIDDWLEGGRAREKLQLALVKANEKKINFDYVFWQGGLIDHSFSEQNYQMKVQKVLKLVKLNARAGKFIISGSVNCSGKINKNHTGYRWDPLLKRFSGPIISELGSQSYTDQCEFNELGNRKMTQLWLRAINEAEIGDRKYQKESLLFYFKT